MKKLFLATIFWLLIGASGAWAQNVTCATRPPGDSSNACASTAFVETAVGVASLDVGVSQITGGTSGLCLYDNAGILGVQSCGTATLTIGTTVISGGVSGECLYNNSGILGNQSCIASTAAKQCWTATSQSYCTGTFTAGTTTTLTLSGGNIPSSVAGLTIYIDGVQQGPAYYTLNTTTGVITFASALASTDLEVDAVAGVPSGGGGLTPIANNNILANTSGSSAAPVATPLTTLYDSLCSTTVGQFWVRLTGAWGCSSLGYIDPAWYGADYTGVADSTTALTNAFNTAVAQNLPLHIRLGTLKVSPTTASILLTIPSSANGFKVYGDGYGSLILNETANSTLFAIDTNNPVYFTDFAYQVGPTPTGGDFITDDLSGVNNSFSQFVGLWCNNVYYCIDLERSAHWVIDRTIMESCYGNCLTHQNLNNQDDGDNVVSDSQFLEFQGGVCATTGTADLQLGGGGMKYIGNKFSCGAVGHELAISSTVNSGTENWSATSLEDQATDNMVYLTTVSGANQWHAVTLSGLEIETRAGGSGVVITGSGGATSTWIGQISITGLTGTVDSLGGSTGNMINASVGEDLAVTGSTVNNGGSGTIEFFVGASTFSGCLTTAQMQASNITRGFGGSAYSNNCSAGSP